MGESDDDWMSLEMASTTHPRSAPMKVSVLEARETAVQGGSEVERWVDQVEHSIASSRNRDVVIYVHGAKVGFEHSCAFAAELKHFAGRDLTAIAFDWPTHREIFSYLDGVDVRHARESADDLGDLIELLAGRTSVRRIHVVAWSAGARVVSRALFHLDQSEDARRKLGRRLGAVVFAAGDVPEADFRERLPAIHRLSERVIVYVSDDDFALKWSSRLMRGGRRLGTEWDEYGPRELAYLRSHPRLEIVDTSYGKETRGFDIRGHRYWFKHPWVNSDLVLALRTDRGAAERGLSKGIAAGIYYFAPDYDERIGSVGKALTSGTW